MGKPIRQLVKAHVLLALFCAVLLQTGMSSPMAKDKPKATLILEHAEDSAWTGLLRNGLEKGGKDFNFETEIIIARPENQHRQIFRHAAANSDLVIVASDNLHEALRDNAANFRKTMFGSIDAGIRASNVMSVSFADEQAAFLAGAAAAILTDSAKPAGINDDRIIGWLSGKDTPAMRSLFNGFSEGAKLVNPETRIVQAVAGSFADPEKAREKTEWLAGRGAAIIALAAGAGNSGAKRFLAGRNLCWIELDRAGSENNAIGAIIKNADAAVYEIMKSAASGHFRGKEIIIYDLANNGVNFAYMDEFEKKTGQKVPPQLARRLKELRHELESGAIRLQSLRQRALCDCLD